MLKINALTPIIPKNAEDPANQFGNLRDANKQLKKRYKAINKGMKSLIDSIDKRVVKEDGGIVTNVKYQYLVDANEFQRISLFIQQLLNQELLGNPQGQFTSNWWLNFNIDKAYEKGTTDALQSAKNISSIDSVGAELSQEVRSISNDDVIFSRPYINRVALLQSRVFEEMKGLTDSSKADLAGTLARGMAAGKGVQELSREVTKRVDVSQSRAKRIVRTEILNAYRTASAAETDELNQDVYSGSDWGMEQLWFSALAQTSRKNHVSRHGRYYSTDEVREFYSINANALNCLCSQSPILVNKKTGEVLQEDLLDRMKKQRITYQKSHGLIAA